MAQETNNKFKSMENSEKPAFPVRRDTTVWGHGLIKREYIAAMAMQGILANHWCQNDYKENIHAMSHQHVAEQAVGYADALLKALGD